MSGDDNKGKRTFTNFNVPDAKPWQNFIASPAGLIVALMIGLPLLVLVRWLFGLPI